MSEYKRFVSYIYEYRNGEKKHSCGFCRAEVRGSQCKLELHMKFSPFPYTPAFQVYTFAAGESQPVGILLGDAAYTRGTVYALFHLPATQIGGRYEFQQLGGLLIQSDAGGIYATSWTDLPLNPDHFINPESSSESTPESMPESVRAASVDTEGEIVPEDLPVSSGEYEQKPDPKESLCVMTTPSDPQTSQPECNPDASSGDLPDADSQEAPVSQAMEIADTFNGGPIPTPEEIQAGLSCSSSPVIYPERSAPVHQEEPQTEESGCSPELRSEDSAEDSEEAEEESEPPSGPAFSSRNLENWHSLRGCYPHIRPFSDGQIRQCLQLTMKDLPELRKNSWFIGSNQFLARGCQQYRHFLLGVYRDDNGQDTGWVLGVPGIYDEKERFLAGMFGFPNFKPARDSSIRSGQFGYWYRFLY